MQQLTFKLVLLLLVSASCCRASDLAALSGYHRPDPFGGIVASDSAGASWDHAIKLSSARGGYVSFQLVIKSDNPCKDCRLSIGVIAAGRCDCEWFHSLTCDSSRRGTTTSNRTAGDKRYYPDALIPVLLPYSFQMPDPENGIDGQKARAFWVDVWIAANTKPGVYHGRARLVDGSARKSVSFTISVRRR